MTQLRHFRHLMLLPICCLPSLFRLLSQLEIHLLHLLSLSIRTPFLFQRLRLLLPLPMAHHQTAHLASFPSLLSIIHP
ncbi:hypothetical protein B0H11DRAFT_2012438 [Mycena galericulata]|nr:hypothetical protein B0H11DRAFT_2143200 [Mycena galericulata]KAJ7467263.1 hypothetical protein B0H11DRAFT_2047201 [Mycena galericulata]KAJ7477835.1 hypothetical protein B0H11DRAFT_2029406 [Mycena galericulata]KAJ7488641.1 hypothetical protein B0H11DRAFT_2012438 [Mycena galericulata]